MLMPNKRTMIVIRVSTFVPPDASFPLWEGPQARGKSKVCAQHIHNGDWFQYRV